MWINDNTKQIFNLLYEIRQAVGNKSLPEHITDADIEPLGILPVLETQIPGFNPITQDYREVAPTKNNEGKWQQTYEVFDLSDAQVAYNEEQRKQANKRNAEQLLSESDWSQYPDVTNPTNTPHLTNGDAWMFYRLELRSIAINPPVTITEWPVKPDEQWSA